MSRPKVEKPWVNTWWRSRRHPRGRVCMVEAVYMRTIGARREWYVQLYGKRRSRVKLKTFYKHYEPDQ